MFFPRNKKNVNFCASLFWLDKSVDFENLLVRGQVIKFDNSTTLGLEVTVFNWIA